MTINQIFNHMLTILEDKDGSLYYTVDEQYNRIIDETGLAVKAAFELFDNPDEVVNNYEHEIYKAAELAADYWNLV